MTEKQKDASRRDFLKLAGTAAPAAIAVAAGGATLAAAETADRTSGTMQDTAHTRAYFESARF